MTRLGVELMKSLTTADGSTDTRCAHVAAFQPSGKFAQFHFSKGCVSCTQKFKSEQLGNNKTV